MKNQTSLAEIECMEKKLANLSKKIDEALAEDRLFLRSLDRVTAHCNRTLSSMKSNSSFYEDKASSSSNTNTTATEHHSRATRESVPVVSSSSAESSLKAIQLFPSAPSQSPSSLSSSALTQKKFIRNLANLREERVRKILVEMKGRTERREHESV
jgi:hypothetical protein